MAHIFNWRLPANTASGAHTNFIKVFRTLPDAVWDAASSDGSNLRFYQADGATEIPREVFYFNKTTKVCEIWIRLNLTLAVSSDLLVQIHADDTFGGHADTAAAGRNAVWVEYRVVSHDGGTTDSTGNETLLASGGPALGAEAGPIGKATRFNGVDQYIRVDGAVPWTSTNSVVLSAWINPDVVDSGQRTAIFARNAVSAGDGDTCQINVEQEGSTDGIRYRHSGGNIHFPESSTLQGNWSLIHAVVPPPGDDTTDDVRLFQSATELTPNRTGGSNRTIEMSSAIQFGWGAEINSVTNFFDGLAAEVRLRDGELYPINNAWRADEEADQSGAAAWNIFEEVVPPVVLSGASVTDITTESVVPTVDVSHAQAREPLALVGNGVHKPLFDLQSPCAVYHNNVTTFVYIGPLTLPYVAQYNHQTGKVTGPVLVSSRDTDGAGVPADQDGHSKPSITRASDGRFHVIHGARPGVFVWNISDTADDITAWTEQPDMWSGSAQSYNHQVWVGSSLYVFFREGSTDNRPLECLKWNGTSWSNFTVYQDTADNWCYPTNVQTDGRYIYISWMNREVIGGSVAGMHDPAIVRIDTQTSDQIQSVFGTVLSKPITQSEYLTHALIEDTGAGTDYTVRCVQMALDGNDDLHFVYLKDEGSDPKLVYGDATGSSFALVDLLSASSVLGVFCNLIVHSPTDIDVFYAKDDGTVERWNGPGTWTLEEVITTTGIQKYPCAVTNADPNLRLVLIEQRPLDFTNADLKAYGWGDAGLATSLGFESKIHWALFPATDPDPETSEVVSGLRTPPFSAIGEETPPLTDGTFSGLDLGGLTPGSSFRLAAAWSNGVEDSGPALSATFDTLNDGEICLRVNISGNWNKAVPYVLESGAWVKKIPHVLASGTWEVSVETL